MGYKRLLLASGYGSYIKVCWAFSTTTLKLDFLVCDKNVTSGIYVVVCEMLSAWPKVHTHLTLAYHQVKILSVYVTQNDEISWRAYVSSICLAKTSPQHYKEALTFRLRHSCSGNIGI